MLHRDDVREARLAVLRTKLAARKNVPGFAANVAAIKKQIHDLESPPDAFRHTETNRFVSLEHAIQNPETTERVEFKDGD